MEVESAPGRGSRFILMIPIGQALAKETASATAPARLSEMSPVRPRGHKINPRKNIHNNVRERAEFQLTSCLDRMRQEDGFVGIVVQGRQFDIGLPEAYRETVIDFRNA